MAAEAAAKTAMENGMKSIEVSVKGPGAGREAAIRSLQAVGLEVNMIKDVTPVPHNGCRLCWYRSWNSECCKPSLRTSNSRCW